MILDSESWMDLRRFRALHRAGVSIAEIARETGLHRRTVRKYLNAELGQAPRRAEFPPSQPSDRLPVERDILAIPIQAKKASLPRADARRAPSLLLLVAFGAVKNESRGACYISV